jgi:hypothetical protein
MIETKMNKVTVQTELNVRMFSIQLKIKWRHIPNKHCCIGK